MDNESVIFSDRSDTVSLIFSNKDFTEKIVLSGVCYFNNLDTNLIFLRMLDHKSLPYSS